MRWHFTKRWTDGQTGVLKISILYLPVRVEIRFDYQSPPIFGDFLQPPLFFRFLSVIFMLQQVVGKEIMEEKMQKR